MGKLNAMELFGVSKEKQDTMDSIAEFQKFVKSVGRLYLVVSDGNEIHGMVFSVPEAAFKVEYSVIRECLLLDKLFSFDSTLTHPEYYFANTETFKSILTTYFVNSINSAEDDRVLFKGSLDIKVSVKVESSSNIMETFLHRWDDGDLLQGSVDISKLPELEGENIKRLSFEEVLSFLERV